ncbi:YdiU family protein [Psychrobacter frigidicola]|uniref:Protein nucleotidyltransferase YdiU n=1 Tax=Psychrobacter frigidicola TaxID=45611 RepID=A0A5C7A5Y4_9GAMM|nr:YdiU family protein [Psychrobacter frigidicola]TXD98070.1 YdiU family protein [Psychrobacter frigidicola]
MRYHNTYVKLDTRLYNRQLPTPLNNPRAGHFNTQVAEQLGWADDDDLMARWVEIIGGHYVPTEFAPLSMAYAGHQFGQWAGQLGDGRGLLMAQVIDNNDQLQDLHLKGSGLTPYSRMGDGRAVLRSTIREYLCGHALINLGIPSSNALGFVVSDTPVRRERIEAGAAMMRVADSHIRLGHVEWIASFAPDLLGEFTDYMIDTYYPECRDSASPVLAFLESVVTRTARMIADWQLIGFAHGVMNTDNLSITGSTLDFGPFGFMERFNPAWINNHSDHSGRYAFQNQPAIGHWNMNTWLPHFMRLTQAGVTRDSLADCLSVYEPTFMQHYQIGLCQKLGLPHQSASLTLAFEFLTLLEDNLLDYTNSFRSLLALVAPTDFPYEQQLLETMLTELNAEALEVWQDWSTRYLTFIGQQIHLTKQQTIESMRTNNPVYVLRNSMAQHAIDAAEQGQFEEVARLFELLSTPYIVQDIATDLDSRPPMPNAPQLPISCSS